MSGLVKKNLTATTVEQTTVLKAYRISTIINRSETDDLLIEFDGNITAENALTIIPESEYIFNQDRRQPCNVLHYKSSANTVNFIITGWDY
jgi:hypothetical protein